MLHGRDDNGIVKCGFLWKHTRGSLRKWKPYYLVLSRPCLLFFKSEDQLRDGRQPKLKVELYDISYIEVVQKKRDNSKRLVVCYETLHDQVILHLKGHDVSDALSWRDKIEDAVFLCKMRKNVHCELKTASFKRQVEQNIRQRVLGSNPHMLSKEIPKVTYLRRVASCEFKGHKLKGVSADGILLAAQRSQSMDDNLSIRSNSSSWRFSPSAITGSSNGLEHKISRSKSSAVNPSAYSRAFLDGVKNDFPASNNNLNPKYAAPSARLSRHSSLLTAVPENRISRAENKHKENEQRSHRNTNYTETKHQSDFYDRADTDFRRHLRQTGSDIYSRDKYTSDATPYGRETAYVHPYRTDRPNAQQTRTETSSRTTGFASSGELNISENGGVTSYQRLSNQRGQPMYQSFHGERNSNTTDSRFERNTPAYTSLHAPTKSPYIGETRGIMGNKYQNSYHGYQSTSNSITPSPFKDTYQPNTSKKISGYDVYSSQNQYRLASGSYHGNRYPFNKISPPGSVSSFGDPRYRIDEGRVWTEKNSDTWSDIDSGFIEERI